MPELSVVMPAFNEAGRIGANVRTLLEALKDLDLEVVVSDDGSADATAAEVERVGDPRAKLVRNPHKGRGAALKAGMAAATGGIVVTVDADLSYGPEEVRKLYGHLKAHPECDLVIGSCWMPGGSVEGVPPFRAWVSRTGNGLLRFAFEGRFWTTTGIFRAYRREKLRDLLPLLGSDGKEFHLEILDRAVRAGWKAEEIPAALEWKRKGGGAGIQIEDARKHLGFLLYRRSDWSVPAILGLEAPLLLGVLALSFRVRPVQPFVPWASLPAGAGVGIQWLRVCGRRIWGGQLAEPDPLFTWMSVASSVVSWLVSLILLLGLVGVVLRCLSRGIFYPAIILGVLLSVGLSRLSWRRPSALKPPPPSP